MTRFASREQGREVLSWIVRKFPEGCIPVDDAQYLIEHPEKLPDMILVMMTRRNITTSAQLQAVVSDWQKLFGHLKVWDFNFSEEHFPLEPKNKVKEVIEKRFDDTATGYDRLRWAESQGLELAGSRATGLYLKTRSQLQMKRPVVGGGQWRVEGGGECVLVFIQYDGRPHVNLEWLGRDFTPDYVWLFSRKSGT